MRVLRSHQHQQICGITVNGKKPRLSRKIRRQMRAVKHHLENDRPATLSKEQLRGWESYRSMVEKDS